MTRAPRPWEGPSSLRSGRLGGGLRCGHCVHIPKVHPSSGHRGFHRLHAVPVHSPAARPEWPGPLEVSLTFWPELVPSSGSALRRRDPGEDAPGLWPLNAGGPVGLPLPLPLLPGHVVIVASLLVAPTSARASRCLSGPSRPLWCVHSQPPHSSYPLPPPAACVCLGADNPLPFRGTQPRSPPCTFSP